MLLFKKQKKICALRGKEKLTQATEVDQNE